MTESEPSLPKHSIHYARYFAALNKEIKRIYAVAESARAKGVDPTTVVEIPPAYDVAARVEATLDGPVGVAKRIRELQKDKKRSREEVAFAVAKEIAIGDLGGITDHEKAADKAVRVALAILTESITAAPIEGISKVRIRGAGSDQYLAIYLAGPIRAAGGTEAAMTVLVADYVRQVLDLPAFKATEEEVERSLEEVELYARAVHLQYPVQLDLLRLAASKLPIMLTGEPTEEFEVSGSRDLERIETNRVRGGAVLVLNDGVVGRAAKLAKIVNGLEMPGWEWLNELAEKTSKAESSEDESEEKKLAPKSEYLADVIGGRPVFSHPSRIGGFRLRYGRSRNTGLAGVGVHPATMFLVDEFLAPGTHIRTERPGKGSIVSPVDTIEGPTVLLRDGTVKQVFTTEEACRLQEKVERIIYLGDILVALGEFLENNHPLVPSGYCEEWWSHDLDKARMKFKRSEVEQCLSGSDITASDLSGFIGNPLSNIPSPEQALHLAMSFRVPLHPRYLYRWLALSGEETSDLRTWLLKNKRIERTSQNSRIVIPNDPRYKELLTRAGIPHSLNEDHSLIRITDSPATVLAQLGDKRKSPKGSNALEALNSCTGIELRDKLGFSIGARMGRPEKAEERKMKPPVHVLFPVGRALSSERRVERIAKSNEHTSTQCTFDADGTVMEPALGRSGVQLEMVSRICTGCGLETFESKCRECESHTEVQPWCSHEECGRAVDTTTGMCPYGHDMNLIRTTKTISVDFQALLEDIKKDLGESQTYNLRGVLGLTSNHKVPEYLGKGVLRAKHDVYTYRDGTARFDATDAPLTHFKPREIGVSVGRLHELGYRTDYQGEPLVSDEQVIELMVQDLVVPENCADYLVNVGNFVDDCLQQIYGVDRYYGFRSREAIIGQLVIGLAPHTSAGIIGRIIGFTNASVCYAHPYWHAAKRRNCDGDEDALILVLDALINFSKAYLPRGRGGFMDAPLVLSVVLDPTEIDDEAHNIEVCNRYPAQFYSMVAEAQHPRVVESLVDIVASRLDTEAQYEGLGFTHGTSSIDDGPRNSRYKTLGSMVEKLDAQLKLAKLIDAVDSQDVAERVLSHHFIRDIRGNLRAYSTQKIQCLKCHRVYRRVPLSGSCVCGAKLSLTVRQKNISKYLTIAERLIREHGLGQYLQQRLNLINSSLDSMFVSEQTSLPEQASHANL